METSIERTFQAASYINYEQVALWIRLNFLK